LLLTTSPQIQLALSALQEELGRATTTQDQVRVTDAMRALIPEVFRKQNEIDALMAEPQAIMQQSQMLQLLERSPALARFAYAQALSGSGEKQSAAALLEQVVQLD